MWTSVSPYPTPTAPPRGSQRPPGVAPFGDPEPQSRAGQMMLATSSSQISRVPQMAVDNS